MKIAGFVILLFTICSAQCTSNLDRSIFRLKPSNLDQLNLLKDLSGHEKIYYWRSPNKVNQTVDLMLSHDQKFRLLKLFRLNGLDYNLTIASVEKLIENEQRNQLSTRVWQSTGDHETITGFWTKYQTFQRILSFINQLAADNPKIVSKVKFGKSYEGRPLVALRIGAKQTNKKPVIFIEGGIHAREWISPATVTFFAQKLVNRFKKGNKDVVQLLKYFDFYIVPVLNADGYAFTHSTDRLWRKNRRPNDNTDCAGTDLNRNFDFDWKNGDSNQCSETYHGRAPFSEAETKAESDLIVKTLKGRVKAYLAIHSYSQLFLYPWGYTNKTSPDSAELARVGKIAVAALNRVSPNTHYTVEQSADLYPASGCSDDWAYGKGKIKYSYTVELRPSSDDPAGFILPPDQIVPTGKETTAALIALAKEVKKATLASPIS